MSAGSDDRKPAERPGGKRAGSDNDPKTGGFYHADTRMGHEHSEKMAEAERIIMGRDPDPSQRPEESERLKRAKKPIE